MLKRRVKRDFIELEPPPLKSSSARLERAHSQQVRPPNQARPPPSAQQVLRPAPMAGGRNHAPQQQQHQHHPPTRPANQPPPSTPNRLSSQAPRLGAGGSSLLDFPDSLDSLEVSASTPSVLNFGAAFNRQQAPNQQQQQQRVYQNSSSSSSSTQMPLIVSSVIVAPANQTSGRIHGNNNNNNSSLVDERPFNDPSWPLMWYLVSSAPYTTATTTTARICLWRANRLLLSFACFTTMKPSVGLSDFCQPAKDVLCWPTQTLLAERAEPKCSV